MQLITQRRVACVIYSRKRIATLHTHVLGPATSTGGSTAGIADEAGGGAGAEAAGGGEAGAAGALLPLVLLLVVGAAAGGASDGGAVAPPPLLLLAGGGGLAGDPPPNKNPKNGKSDVVVCCCCCSWQEARGIAVDASRSSTRASEDHRVIMGCLLFGLSGPNLHGVNVPLMD